MYCQNPYPAPRKPGSDRPAMLLPCRRCGPCLNTMKNNLTGRLVAEAKQAKSVYMLTLTYADEPEDFCYLDVQLALKRFRKALAALPKPARVRFACVGERGEQKGRIHWHILLFFDREFLLKRPRPGRLWPFWPFGWTQVAPLGGQQDIADGIRYVVKYCVKGVGDPTKSSTRFRGSVRLGEETIVAHAVAQAEAKSRFDAYYTLSECAVSRGPRAGNLYRLQMAGAVARSAALAFARRWEELWPDHLFPDTPAMNRYYYRVDAVRAELEDRERVAGNAYRSRNIHSVAFARKIEEHKNVKAAVAAKAGGVSDPYWPDDDKERAEVAARIDRAYACDIRRARVEGTNGAPQWVVNDLEAVARELCRARFALFCEGRPEGDIFAVQEDLSRYPRLGVFQAERRQVAERRWAEFEADNAEFRAWRVEQDRLAGIAADQKAYNASNEARRADRAARAVYARQRLQACNGFVSRQAF